jgi:hypothetical protein
MGILDGHKTPYAALKVLQHAIFLTSSLNCNHSSVFVAFATSPRRVIFVAYYSYKGSASRIIGLFTGVRGIGILRTSPFGYSWKFAYTEF